MKTRSTCKRIRLAVMFWMSACMVASLVYVTTTARAAITERKREPVVVSATAEIFPRWFLTAAASDLELWTLRNGAWHLVPFQVDEVSERAMDVKPFILPSYSGSECDGSPNLPPISVPGPCEFLHSLRGTLDPDGSLSLNDEIVFIAGSAGACNASTSSWPSDELDGYRYRIGIEGEGTPGAEGGCVYLYRRTQFPRPGIPDLVSYDGTGDGTPQNCRPAGTGACGAIVAQSYDIDADGSADMPSYRMDFWGNWTADRLQIGEAALNPGEDMVDIVKSRIMSPPQNEQRWDLQGLGQADMCASFVGTIDGRVRVVRVIQGARSGATTRKLELAYPGEVLTRIYMRVHPVGGPILTYHDLNEATVSPPGARAEIFKADLDGDGTLFLDAVDGVEHGEVFPASSWWQVSSSIGSFLEFQGANKNIPSITEVGRYNDTTSPLWTATTDWDEEEGDRGAARTELHATGSSIPDTQNIYTCEDPRTDTITPIRERVLYALSPGRAPADAGKNVMAARSGVLSQCITGEQRGVPVIPSAPCRPVLVPVYEHDGGPVELRATGCDDRGWNVYHVFGGGVTRRIGTVAPGRAYNDVTLKLNEERTYKATAFSSDASGCAEGPMSDAVVVVHNDTAPTAPPSNLTAYATPGRITASWEAPLAGDLHGFKLLSSTLAGGPYLPVHPGALPIAPTTLSFPAVGGGATHYIVVKALDVAGNWSLASNEAQVTVP